MKGLRKIINIQNIPCLLLNEEIIKCNGILCFRKFFIRKYFYKEKLFVFLIKKPGNYLCGDLDHLQDLVVIKLFQK